MTAPEVKATVYAGGLGLFATQEIKEGTTIFAESSSIARLAPVDDEQEARLLQVLPPPSKKKNKDALFLDTIQVPNSVPPEYANKYKCMLQAAACFAEFADPSCQSDLSALCRPADNDVIVSVAKEGIKYIQHHSKGESSLRTMDPELLLGVMLVYTSNSFAGGRIYDRSSRLNHSCNPNCVVVPQGDAQSIVAACDITDGEELTISYLGTWLYADTATRQSKLQVDKHFVCQCTRCTTYPNTAAAVPCPKCHERQGRYLEDDVAYDDDLMVHYCLPLSVLGDSSLYNCEKCGNLEQRYSPALSEVSSLVSAKVIHFLDTRSVEDDDLDLQEQLLELATMTLGTKHWTTNLLSLLRTDAILKEQHTTMIQTSEPPSMEDVAQVIDSIERLERFIQSLDLKLHMGHVLSYSMIGVARSLVSLGDFKSKTYASKWILKIKAYTNTFESEGMKKVVSTLENAYKDGDDDYGDNNKKQRT